MDLTASLASDNSRFDSHYGASLCCYFQTVFKGIWLTTKRISLKTFLWGYLFPVVFILFTEKTFYLRWGCMLPLGFRPSSCTLSISPTVTTKLKPVKNVIPSFIFAEPHGLEITGNSQPWVRMFPIVNWNWMEVNRVIIWPTEALLLRMMCEKERLQIDSLLYSKK